MLGKKNLQEMMEKFKNESSYKENIVHWHTIPEKKAIIRPFPQDIDNRLLAVMQKRGIQSLYSHQEEAYQFIRKGRNIVAVTPTASGKTLCYNLPVLQSILENNHARALYIFPTKALSYDQKSELEELIDAAELNINSYTYDGDTPTAIRQKIRKAGHIVITNPDMLHSAILPHHTKWVSLFENLQYIVIDELHTYKGVFGSHMANVLRRLKRICRFYGSQPVFICTSATIANPAELAELLTGEKVQLIDRNGAPAGTKHFVFYNPPIVNKPLNVRRSSVLEVRTIAADLLKNRLQTIVFARSRVRVEILLKYLQEMVQKQLGPNAISGYRGGYLPTQRRAIEKGLRNGSIYGVVSTNALELGVDIGQLQVCIMTGYPGSIASAWQQAGRAGRRHSEALIIMVASSNPMDQFVIQHPEYFFDKSPETARINPDNLIILVDHIKCAAFEIPFKHGELFGELEINEILEYLTEERVLHVNKDKWHWMSDAFPAHDISLRSASQENIVIIDRTDAPKTKVIGETDRFSAMTLLHDEAIYLHQGIQYQVEYLDWEEKKAYVREVNVDYYTDANLAVQLDVLEIDMEKKNANQNTVSFGDVSVRAMATLFKKIKFDTHENIGSGPIHLPEEELHTNAVMLSIGCLQAWDEARLENGLIGVAHALGGIVPLYVMCDRTDIHVAPQIKAAHNELPTIFIYDRYPGGIGLSKHIYENNELILVETARAIRSCSCENGCPSCIGTDGSSHFGKQDALILLQSLMGSEGEDSSHVH